MSHLGQRTWRITPGTVLTPRFIDELASALPAYREAQAQDEARRLTRRSELLTAAQASRELQVTPDVIRQWSARGHLSPAGKQGRLNLYRRDALQAAQSQVAARRKVTKRTDRWFSEAEMDKHVTTTTAARAVNISSSTLRMWAKRGCIKPTGVHKGQLVFRFGDVFTFSNRNR